MMKDTKEKVILVAVVDDGFRWLKRGGFVWPDGDRSLDDGGSARSTFVRNAVFLDGEWRDSEGWTMFLRGGAQGR